MQNMIDKANANKAKVNASNVQFVESAITSIPLPDNTADCIISNCVINLVPASENQLVFNEMFRLLKPGGRVAVSDILARKELTEEIKNSVALYVGCVAGASQVSEYDAFLKNAGFDGKLNLLRAEWRLTRTGRPSYCRHQERLERVLHHRWGRHVLLWWGSCRRERRMLRPRRKGVMLRTQLVDLSLSTADN